MKRNIENILLWMLVFIIMAPVYMVVCGSLKSNHELTDSLAPVIAGNNHMISWKLFPLYPTFMHYIQLLLETPQFFVVFWNSVKIVGLILAGQILVSIPAAWAFSKFNFNAKKIIFTIYIVLMLMPFQVTMLPSYLVLNKLNLINTQSAVILPAIFSTFPVFLMYRGFQSIPNVILEAAQVDGAGDVAIFLHMGIPLGSSGILSALVLGFLEYWNLIEQPLAFLKDKSLWPLSLYLPEIDLSKAGIVLAASVITLIPAVFVFVMGQDYLEKGIVSTGIKE